MPTAVPGSRALWPLALILSALTVALALPGAARAADDQSCYGSVKRIKPNAERNTGASYAFSCQAAITGFTLVSTSPIAGFDVTADVFDSKAAGGGLRGDDRFGECGGDLPGSGFHCNGTYSTQGRVVRASFDGLDSPCARDKKGQVKMRVGLVVTSASGKIAGPYELGRVRGCPKPKKHKHKHK